MSLLNPVGESADGTDEIDTGPNLEFDPDFDGLDRAAQGKPDQQFGDLIVPAEDPDWKDVKTRAEELLARSRDLRVLAHLAVARLHLSGLPAFGETLAEIRQLLERAWDKVHPQLDPDDDNDPTLRANALLRLADPRRVLRTLRTLPLANSARAGRISWRDIGIALGSIEPEEGAEKPTEAVVTGAFRDTDAAALATLATTVAGTIRDVRAVNTVFDEKAGYGTGPALDELSKLLGEIQRYLTRFTPAQAVAEPAADELADAGAAGGEPGTVAAAPVRAAGGFNVASLTAVNSRADALHLLGLVCDYYTRVEPSSPLPLLIERARRLADKSFLDILRDLAPDGLGQAQTIAGAETEGYN